MIIDKLSNLQKHVKDPELANSIKNFLENAEQKEVGKHEIYGGTFAKVQEYLTKTLDQVKMEAHVKYLDLQYIHSGSEIVIYKDIDGAVPETEYNDVKDVTFYAPTDYKSSELNAGCFAIMFQNDLHQCIANGAPENIKKVVVKIPVSEF
ncbi:MAG: YhcH/YjgK/YiaL family protein [Clostridia bacterium]|nr:YhcH/YjgK/YiaL family protein [Clostridia bacterium]